MGVEVCGVVFPLVLAFLFVRVCGGGDVGGGGFVRLWALSFVYERGV